MLHEVARSRIARRQFAHPPLRSKGNASPSIYAIVGEERDAELGLVRRLRVGAHSRDYVQEVFPDVQYMVSTLRTQRERHTA
jgi:hypothetical protein